MLVLPTQRRIGNAVLDLLESSMALKKLDGALTFLGRPSSFERAEVPTLSGFGVLFPGVETITARR